MTHSTSRTFVAFLALAAIPSASAGDFFPVSAGDRWTTTADVYTSHSQLSIPGVTQGEARQVSVRAELGGWRLLSDFGGLGPFWVHAGRGERLYLWDGSQAQLLIDLDDDAGYESVQVVSLRRHRLEAWLQRKDVALTTRAGSFTCHVVQVAVLDALGINTNYELWFARGVGLVRWVRHWNSYDFGVYYDRVYETHDREPELPRQARFDVAGALNGVRAGSHAFVATGSDLVDVDLVQGTTRSLGIAASELHRLSNRVAVTGYVAGRQESHELDLVSGLVRPLPGVLGRAIPLPALFGRSPLRTADLSGFDVATRTSDGTEVARADFQGPLGYGGEFGVGQEADRLYIPLAYPGGIGELNTYTGQASRIDTFDWLHDVKVLGGGLFVVGQFNGLGRVDRFDPTAYVDLLPGERVGPLLVKDDHVYTVAGQDVVKLDADGAVVLRAPVPGLTAGAGFGLAPKHRVLDVQLGKALVLVADEGLRLIDLR